MAEVCEQTSEVIAIRGRSGKLPIHVETVENAWLTYARREISMDVHVHAALYESLAILPERRRAEGVGARASAANGHDDLQIRMQFLELLELMKVAREGAVAVGLTVNGVRGGEGGLVVCIRVKADASIVDHVREGIVEMGQQTGGTAGDNVLDKIVRVHPPTRKVADNFHRVRR